MSPLCATISALAARDLAAMDQMNQGLAALRRLAELLDAVEDVADPRALVPALDELVPLDRLTLDGYQTIAAGCPDLGLDPNALTEFKQQLRDAYDRLLSQALGHPWLRFDGLQRTFARLSLEVECSRNFQKYLACAAAICAGTEQLVVDLRRDQAVVDEFNRNFLTNAGGVLNARMERKRAAAIAVVNQLKSLNT